MADADKHTCPVCDRDDIGITQAGKLRSHKANGDRCNGSGLAVTQLPPERPESCDDTPQQPANSATCSNTSDTGDPPQATPLHTSPTPTNPPTTEGTSPDAGADGEPTPEPTPGTLPGVDDYAEKLDDLASQQLEAYRAKVQERMKPFDLPAVPLPEVEQPPLFDRPSQSGTRAARVLKEQRPMTPFALEVAARLKEMFHAYSNRLDRNQQATLGPSEIGTPCDRRIALSLMRYPAVNPGGDNWASFVGTCGHRGLEEMFLWADAGSGRYAPEVRLTFPSKHVPKGTTDLIDRALLAAMDHKFMGTWSLDKLKTEGPSRTYRVQLHTYALGATMMGEKIEKVVLVAWPRQGSSLDDLYVWEEDFNPELARKALRRVDDIGAQLKGCTDTYGLHNDGCGCPDTEAIAYSLPMDNSDCRFCPFYMRGAVNSEGGKCNGRR